MNAKLGKVGSTLINCIQVVEHNVVVEEAKRAAKCSRAKRHQVQECKVKGGKEHEHLNLELQNCSLTKSEVSVVCQGLCNAQLTLNKFNK